MTYGEMLRLAGYAHPDARGRWATSSKARGKAQAYAGPSKRTLKKRAAKRAAKRARKRR